MVKYSGELDMGSQIKKGAFVFFLFLALVFAPNQVRVSQASDGPTGPIIPCGGC
jgi:hypothetical protein